VGADVVEVIPAPLGATDVTSLVAARVVRELLNGLALRRDGERTGRFTREAESDRAVRE
jgi:hypothetical protein